MEVFSSVWLLNLETFTWTCAIKKGINLVGHSATLYKNRIYILVQATLYVLHLSNMEFEHVPSMDCSNLHRARKRLPALSYHSAVLVNNLIYVFGGKFVGHDKGQSLEDRTFEKCNADVLVLNLDSLAWSLLDVQHPPPTSTNVDYNASPAASPSSDTPRAESQAVFVAPHYIFVVGGFTSVSPRVNVIDTGHLYDVQVLNLNDNRWLQIWVTDQLCAPRSCHSATLIGDEIVVFGGTNDAQPTMSELCVLNLGLATIEHLKAPPPPNVVPTSKPSNTDATTSSSSTDSSTTSISSSSSPAASSSIMNSASPSVVSPTPASSTISPSSAPDIVRTPSNPIDRKVSSSSASSPPSSSSFSSAPLEIVLPNNSLAHPSSAITPATQSNILSAQSTPSTSTLSSRPSAISAVLSQGMGSPTPAISSNSATPDILSYFKKLYNIQY